MFLVQFFGLIEQIGVGEKEAFGIVEGNGVTGEKVGVMDNSLKIFVGGETLLFNGFSRFPPRKPLTDGESHKVSLSFEELFKHLRGCEGCAEDIFARFNGA